MYERSGRRSAPRAYWQPKRAAQLIALVLAAVAATVVLFVPSYTTVISNSQGNETIASRTVWEVNGPMFLLVMAIPVAITILPLLVRGPAWPLVSVIAAALIGLFAVVGSLTIGFYFIPAVGAELIAVFLSPRPLAARPIRSA